jgi:hypothetical protein
MADDVAPQIVAPIVKASDDLTDPVIQHTEKITRIEEKQAQQEEKLFRELGELESRVRSASEETAQGLYTRINEIEAKLAAIQVKPVEDVEAIPGEAVEFAEPIVESSPAPPEKERRGLRHRRRARKNKK